MSKTSQETYNGWSITVKEGKNLCAKFSFDITDPKGKTQHVKMGGENEQRAMERAREMIVNEIAFQSDE